MVEVREEGQQRRREERSSFGRRRPAGQPAERPLTWRACVLAGFPARASFSHTSTKRSACWNEVDLYWLLLGRLQYRLLDRDWSVLG
jgi:hypothetical protein